MRGALLVVFMASFGYGLSGQEFVKIESPWEKNIPDCYSIGYNLMRLIPQYHEQQKWDSLGYMVEYYNQHCEMSDHFKHFELLNAISTSNFIRSDYPKLLSILNHYHYNSTTRISGWDQPEQTRLAWLTAHRKYYEFLNSWAKEELLHPPTNQLQKDILIAYSGDELPLLEKLKSDNYSDALTQQEFNNVLMETVYGDEFSFDLFTGVWIPHAKLNRLGSHPLVGFTASGYTNKMRYSAGASFRFLKAANEYMVRRDDSIFVDDYFFSFNIGIDAYRSLYRDLRSDISVGAGIAYDGITFHVYEGEEYEAENLSSPNFHLGMAYTFYYNYQNYVRLEGRYSFLNYQNHINANLSGNALEIRLIFGFSDNHSRKMMAKRLNP